MKQRRTTDAIQILHALYASTPKRQRDLDAIRLNMEIARLIYDLREKAGLTQGALARRIGTTQSVISRLEDADYEGHSLRMLNRIASALGGSLHVSIRVPKRRGSRRKKAA
jgi:ribosome-binding protein aMBF1 (putative translation factor)